MTTATACRRYRAKPPSGFTGKERDSESGNDYFGARYYASTMGRFLSPDWSAKEEPVPYAKLGDPQSLNLYAYVLNNPLIHVDPDGHACRQGDWGCNSWSANSANNEWNSLHQIQAQKQSSNSYSSGTRFWHGLRNLFHGHSWNYIKTSVTDNETYTVAGVLAPGANAAAQAAKAAAKGRPTPSAPPTLRPVPGPDPVPPQVPPGEVPEIEPGAPLLQKLGVAALNIVKMLGNAADGASSDILPPMYIDPNIVHPQGGCPKPDCTN